MLQSSTRTFTDPDDFQSAVRAANVRTIITSAGNYSANLTRIDLHKLWMQRGWASLSSINHLAMSAPRAALCFSARPNQPIMLQSGFEVGTTDLITMSLGAEHYLCTPSGTEWAALSLSPAYLAEASRALLHRDLSPPALTKLIRPPPSLMMRLRQLHDAATHLARTVPEILVHPEVARAIEDELVRVVLACLDQGIATDTGVRELRVPVMRRFERVLEENVGRPLYMTEICTAIGVSSRMLRLRCAEELGMSPHQYLWLRRMNLAQRALAHADAETATVTEIAMGCGFGELGRFSVAYRKLFGESPSATLRRSPRDTPLANSDNFPHMMMPPFHSRI